MIGDWGHPYLNRSGRLRLDKPRSPIELGDTYEYFVLGVGQWCIGDC